VNLYGTDPAKVTVLYPPTQFDFEKAERSAKAPKPFTLDSGSVNFLFVSSSHQRKGFDLLEPFFESTDLPVKLYVAGRDLPKGRNYRNIEYLGYFEDIYSVYPHFDYSVLASSYEPFGLAPVESLVCGTPVVIAENLGCSEIIPEDLKITFKRTEKSLEEAVRQAVRERDARKRSAAENKDRIRALFNTGDAHFGEILRIAEKLAGER
jgi:glycosyltransferase involved in cell wall biosynthesis